MLQTGEIVRDARPPVSRQLLDGMRALLTYPITVWRHREIVQNFYSRELRSRFRGTMLGFLWPFVLPLVLFAVYYFVFVELLNARFGSAKLDLATQKTWFTVYLFVGVIVWSGFAESITRNASIILENSNLIKKISFPSEILPLNTILVALTIQTIAIGAFLALAPLLGWNPWSFHLLAIPLVGLVQAFLALGPSLAVAASNVYIRDTAPILGIAMTFWQFATPVFWSTAVLDATTLERYQWAFAINPMYHLLEAWRMVLVNPGLPLDDGQLSHPWPFVQCATTAWTALAWFVIGHSIFYFSKRRFADEM